MGAVQDAVHETLETNLSLGQDGGFARDFHAVVQSAHGERDAVAGAQRDVRRQPDLPAEDLHHSLAGISQDLVLADQRRRPARWNIHAFVGISVLREAQCDLGNAGSSSAYASLILALADARTGSGRGRDGPCGGAEQDARSKHKGNPSSAGCGGLAYAAAAGPGAGPTGHPGPFRLVQKNKMFTPHLLVVPTGSSVEFPNEDPFFHNVFSLFNGKRFDLGLYESGTSRAVRFDREGVSYIFCNIHPEMGAVVLAMSTPYWAVSNAAGEVSIPNVPPGSYKLHVWSEAAQSANLAEAERTVQVGAAPMRLDPIVLQAVEDPMEHHKNKFGEDYRPSHTSPY